MMLREATEEDLEGILAIFNQVIATSTAVWIDEATTKEERRQFNPEPVGCFDSVK